MFFCERICLHSEHSRDANSEFCFAFIPCEVESSPPLPQSRSETNLLPGWKYENIFRSKTSSATPPIIFLCSLFSIRPFEETNLQDHLSVVASPRRACLHWFSCSCSFSFSMQSYARCVTLMSVCFQGCGTCYTRIVFAWDTGEFSRTVYFRIFCSHWMRSTGWWQNTKP